MTRYVPRTILVVWTALSFLPDAVAPTDEVQAERLGPRMSLNDLLTVKLPDVRIESVKQFRAGEDDAQVDHVQLLGVIGGNIGFELLLPDQWNERFVMGGGGLFVGAIQNQARFTVNSGFATVGTDTGHRSETVFHADWAYLDFEAQLNFGYLSVHRTAEVAKCLIGLYYGRDPKYSYFFGCSTGGRQGLMEAARFPRDFNGIISGCPVASMIRLYAAFIKHAQEFFLAVSDGGQPLLTEKQLNDFHSQVLRQCDEQDGLKDGIINDPTACALDWSQITGLDTRQLAALKATYEGPMVGTQSLYPGLPMGSELEWHGWFAGPEPDSQSGIPISALEHACTEFGRYLVFDDPAWSPRDYDIANWARDTRRAAKIIDCDDPDLQPLHAAGGKLIVWHGWCDGTLTARGSIEYFEKIHSPAKNEFLRLYLLPGVGHCGGGPGPSDVDWISIVSQWVERGVPPDRLVATKRDEAGTVVMSRPVYPYPIAVRYRGRGNANDAESFERADK